MKKERNIYPWLLQKHLFKPALNIRGLCSSEDFQKSDERFAMLASKKDTKSAQNLYEVDKIQSETSEDFQKSDKRFAVSASKKDIKSAENLYEEDKIQTKTLYQEDIISSEALASDSAKNQSYYSEKIPLAKLGEFKDAKLLLGFNCKVCNTRNTKFISKQAYKKGVVIVKCGGCGNHHLIADNLGMDFFISVLNIKNIYSVGTF